MYQPAFLEIFAGFAVAAAWARWLWPRVGEGRAQQALSALPWVAGGAVLVGQLVAVASFTAADGGNVDTAERLVALGRWGSALVVIAALALELALTVRARARTA
ncbi:MAG: hypothetical protein R3F59_23315 [Myxococcota bacterium]